MPARDTRGGGGAGGGARPRARAPRRRGRATRRMAAALGYASRLTLAQQRARLNTLGPYIWVDRDSHWYPDYISTRCYPDYGFFKIFDSRPGRCIPPIKLVTDRDIVEAELARLVEQARELVLAAID